MIVTYIEFVFLIFLIVEIFVRHITFCCECFCLDLLPSRACYLTLDAMKPSVVRQLELSVFVLDLFIE